MAEVIVALDLPSGSEALRLLDRLPEARWVKVGSILMTREGPDLVRVLTERGLRVFLDLKWHDIPNTVAEAVAAAAGAGRRDGHGAHAGWRRHDGGGRRRGRRARSGLVGVTVLTSHDPAAYARAVGRREVDLADEVERQSGEAVRAGLAGVVCSPHEVALVRGRIGADALIVVPGIRGRADARGDQVRVATAADAVAAGATHLVVGRPILQAADPSAAFRGLLEEAQCVGS